jgi:hypothetical protein
MKSHDSNYLFPLKISAKECSVSNDIEQASLLQIISETFGINHGDIEVDRSNSAIFLWNAYVRALIPMEHFFTYGVKRIGLTIVTRSMSTYTPGACLKDVILHL